MAFLTCQPQYIEYKAIRIRLEVFHFHCHIVSNWNYTYREQGNATSESYQNVSSQNGYRYIACRVTPIGQGYCIETGRLDFTIHMNWQNTTLISGIRLSSSIVVSSLRNNNRQIRGCAEYVVFSNNQAAVEPGKKLYNLYSVQGPESSPSIFHSMFGKVFQRW